MVERETTSRGNSQLTVKKWHKAIGDATLADVILDRLVHHSHRLPLKGTSMRTLDPKTRGPAGGEVGQ